MNRISSILVIVDPTADAHPAITKGALLAESFNARLELFTCDTKASREERHAAHVRARPDEPFVANLKAQLESLAVPLRARGMDVTTEWTCADPLHAGLLERVQKTTADLVLKDTHHHTLARRTFLTNTDWHLIRGCPVPLLLTKVRPWPRTPRIVAAVDPGHINDKPAMLDRCILDQASAFSRSLNGELHVIHANIPMRIVATTLLPLMAVPTALEEFHRNRDARFKEVQALALEYGVAAERVHLQIGGPVEVLPRVTEEIRADIVAIGAISRSGVKRAFIGSTAEDVLERLPCDALIVKTPDFAELLPF